MKTQKILLDYSSTNFFSKTILDYLSGNKSLKPFYQFTPEISSFNKTIEIKSKEKIDRKSLVEILQLQNAKLKTLNTKLSSTIDLLKNENTFTITTAHQPILFTGPLYFIYKIINAINLSEQLKMVYPGYNFIPVFWMNGEDHDFAEVNHANIFGRKIVWKVEKGAGTKEEGTEEKKENLGAVGKIKTDPLKNVLDEIKNILGEGENAKRLMNLFSEAYLQHSNFADATRFIVNELFGEYGLVVIDSDDKRLKEIFAPVMEDEILNSHCVKLVNSTIQQLEKNGYDAQSKPREINLFYLTENSREKIGTSEIINRKSEIINFPQRFSPNVLLRCLFQEMILPNIAYIGGGGELAYWLEMKNLFEHYKINFPILLLRNSVLWIDKNNSERMKKLNLEPKDLFSDTEILINKFVEAKSEVDTSLEKEKVHLENFFKNISIKAKEIDPTLEGTVLSEHKKVLSSLENIENKILKAEKRKHETAIQQIRSLKEKLFPENELQERYDNFIQFYLKYGKEFISVLKEELNVTEKKFTVIIEE